jgi:hypothetical protein
MMADIKLKRTFDFACTFCNTSYHSLLRKEGATCLHLKI